MPARSTAAVRLLAGDKEPVRLASTANLALAGLLTVDGVVSASGNRILVKNQTAPTTNGIYTVSEGDWHRAPDSNSARVMIKGMKVTVQEGAANTGSVWSLSTDRPNLGTDNIAYELFLNTTTQAAINDARETLVAETDAIIATALAAGKATQAEAEAGVSNVGWMTPLRVAQEFAVRIANQGGDAIFQQTGAGTVPLTVVQVLREWHTLPMYGGGTDKTAAQNAAAFVAARNVLRLGGKLTVTPGFYNCDRVQWYNLDGGYTNSMIIEGTAGLGGPANNNAVISFSGTGAAPFWDFNAPASGGFGGSAFTVKNLYFIANDPTFSGALISSTTPVTDGSKITSHFWIEQCGLSQQGGVAGVGTLLDLGKTIETSVVKCNFGGGAVQIKGQQGLTVAGTAQARQSTTVDVRKCQFIACNGTPILYGGEGWGMYDNVFEASAGGRMRCFSTNSNYPIKNMTWINNWCGDISVAGDQAFVFYGQGLVFMGNFVGGAWSGSGAGQNAISLEAGFKGFNISGNSFDNCSAAINSGGATVNYGSIEGNVLNSGSITVGTFGASVRIANNGI